MSYGLRNTLNDFIRERHPIHTFIRKAWILLCGNRIERNYIAQFVRGLTLNIGCGGMKFPKAVNIDKDPKVAPDMVADIHDVPRPFMLGTVDCIIVSHILEHLHDPEEVVFNLSRCLKRGGVMVILLPDWDFQKEVAYFRTLDHVWRAQKSDLWRLSSRCLDLRIVEMDTLPWPLTINLLLEKV